MAVGLDNPYLPALPTFLRGLGPDIVHAHSHLFLANLQAIRAAHRLHIPSVLSVHGVMAQRGNLLNFSQLGYLASIGSWVINHSSIVLCLTKSDAHDLEKFHLDTARVRIVPNGIYTDHFRPLTENEGTVLWVGRFVPEKGLDLMLKIAEIVCHENKSARFFLVGDGPLRSRIDSLVEKMGLRANVTIFPRMTQSEIATIMGQCSLFIMPSLKEGFPKAILEAMSCGKPVVAFDLPGLIEVVSINSSGILVPRYDTSMFAKTILQLLEDGPHRRTLGDNGRRAAVEKYDWSVVAKIVDRIYEEALDIGSATWA
jgi:glycosyltransferase involved in cell wall biosynthesis